MRDNYRYNAKTGQFDHHWLDWKEALLLGVFVGAVLARVAAHCL